MQQELSSRMASSLSAAVLESINKQLCQMHIKRFCFRARLIPTLATIVVFPILIHLGFWQLDRAQQKIDLKTQFQERAKASFLKVSDLEKDQQDLRYYPIKLSGHLDNQHHILLDNKMYKHRVGYQVLTPLITQQTNKIILLNRGWIPRGADRNRLPKIEPVTDEVTVSGKVYLPSKKTYVLSNQLENIHQWPLRVQKIDFKQIAKALNKTVLPYVVLLDKDQRYGFVRDWQPITTKPQKHQAYAFQWFALALTLLVIYLVVNSSLEPREK